MTCFFKNLSLWLLWRRNRSLIADNSSVNQLTWLILAFVAFIQIRHRTNPFARKTRSAAKTAPAWAAIASATSSTTVPTARTRRSSAVRRSGTRSVFRIHLESRLTQCTDPPHVIASETVDSNVMPTRIWTTREKCRRQNTGEREVQLRERLVRLVECSREASELDSA